ncbi:Tll0287-like domain-containing protein [Lutimonas zeaxanthinifaciens]|uniref:Tll0287-like domain-containing protein n=1 Tax=Lutimonas zeaxanthinifaciens TaxID=3060215 RepID=UPI00265C95C5|nr:DUF3365 domain-containing protein [Lutimonas sp. YSD2104]WKK66137.1 DUF3365 domain-containing protein [Lutimonas sp. YSD2104]
MKEVTFILFLSVLFFSCSKQLTKKESELFKERGNQIVQKTAEELSGNLMSKMKEGGIPLAVEYCNTAALPLTSKVSEAEKVTIKRTSLKTRNSLNEPNEEELKVLKKYTSQLKKDVSPEAIVEIDHSGKPHYYAPILVEKKCLMCHGTIGKELSKQADSVIKSFYPNDLATGFSDGDLRGIWSISFP